MKAVLLAPEFSAHNGGIQRIMRLYLSAMATDEKVQSLGLVALNDRPEHLTVSNAQTNGKPLQTEACAGSRTAFLRATRRICRQADRIVCGHVAQLPAAVIFAPRQAQLAFVAHGIEAWPPLPLLLRIGLRRVNRVFCVSRYTKERLATNHPQLTARLRIVPNALDPALFNLPPPLPPPAAQAPIVLCVGRLCTADDYKGYDLLLHAFAKLPATGTFAPRLRFIGEGDDQSRLQQLATDLGIATRVEFSGRLADAELRRAFADCTCLALPSTGEGFGLVYLEAMAAGRPCVGVNATAVPELITPSVGCLAHPGDIVSLTAALKDCLARTWNPLAIRETALRFSLPQLAATLASAWD
jgi:glycosyltransferase involved in cell wall biosynthesis